MSQKNQKEGHSIFTFKKGDIIVRLKSRIITEVKTNDNLGTSVEVQIGIENSFRRPVEFICVENNQIYLREIKPAPYCNGGFVYKANLEEYCEDWALFVVPDGLTMDDCI